ncbi:hypothetical protein VNO78_18297 [Psophocarpus tetragonolobus]|uniref:Calmodulin-binding protein n=1 Tax=Psophocarpus tetragonolobus TaxID=3891 RepID=A0AAN9SJ29_PSOTE
MCTGCPATTPSMVEKSKLLEPSKDLSPLIVCSRTKKSEAKNMFLNIGPRMNIGDGFQVIAALVATPSIVEHLQWGEIEIFGAQEDMREGVVYQSESEEKDLFVVCSLWSEMASKRTNEEENGIVAKRRRGLGDDPQAQETDTMLRLIASNLEPVIRKVIKEELPSTLQGYACACPHHCCRDRQCSNSTTGGRAMQLCFVNRLPKKIFTLAHLTAEDGDQLQIELRYAASQQRVVTEQVSNMEVRICVLNGDFENHDWSAEEFNAGIVIPRRGPLLRGDTRVKLQKGVAYINNKMIMFTDNSCWTRTQRFRLGLQIVESKSLGAGIREGRSQPFRVLDNRGQSYKKFDHPSLDDKVWRLRNIAKGGRLHKQLSSNGIKTVKDLLRLDTIGSLQERFGRAGAWDKIIAHAKDCKLDDNERYFYPYYHQTDQSKSVFLVFNCIYDVVEVMFNGQHCRSPQSLNLEEQRLVERVKQEVYKNLQGLVPIDGLLQHPCLPAHQGLEPSPSIIEEEGANNGPFDSDQLPGKVPLNLSACEAFFNSDAGIGNEWSDSVALAQIGEFQSDLWGTGSFPYGDGTTSSNHYFFRNHGVNTSIKGKFWQRTRTILKWVMSLHKLRRYKCLQWHSNVKVL